jgi:RNA polymerase sigma factor (sigma-70 family)
MTDSALQNARQDQAAVAAVRGGDAERYRELVERHQRRVFAVAWSRLGDAALAEEASQEAFIRAYRRLWLLGDGAKFAGWVNTIARRVAINFGLRHRRELNKRQRWALENPPTPAAQDSADEADPLYTPETLRQTLAELPDAPRECLVLFYLEGQSGAEAAAALGISEGALRVRLHRARAAMRERLEEKLEGSLAKLGPATSLVPNVMAGVLASSSAKTAMAGGTAAIGAGAKILSVLGKTFLFSWMVPLIALIGFLPSLLFASIFVRMERKNFRDQQGFRPQLYQRFSRSFLWGFPLIFVFMAVLVWAMADWGIHGQMLAFACFGWMISLVSARSLTICRSPYQLSSFFFCVIIAAGVSAEALGWIPPSLVALPILLANALLFYFFKQRPARMDYSLFLRASHGLLTFSGGGNGSPPENRFDRQTLLVFARFLGARFLAINFRWAAAGLRLRLPTVGGRFLTGMASMFMPPISRNCSHILLGWDGTIVAHCGRTDAAVLTDLNTARMTNPRELEGVVAETVHQAWREFRAGNLPAAARMVGDSPESEVFLVPPARAKYMRWCWFFLGAMAVLLVAQMMLQYWQPAWMEGMKPVSVTEAQVRAFLNDTMPFPDRKEFKFNSPTLALFTCLVLPSTNLFSPAGLQAMRNEVAAGNGFDMTGKAFETLRQNSGRAQAISFSSMVRDAVVYGWISWSDLGLQPAEAAAALRTNRFQLYSPDQWDHLLTRCAAWSWVKEQKFDVMRIQSDGITQLRLLQAIHCLDLTDREKLIQQIASVQTLSGTPPGQPPIHDWHDVRGLFFTPCWPALQDTYNSLAALEILGGLDKINREACIKGILSRHRGKGWFTSPNSGGFNEYHIDGSARDTIAAFESLRILGALDRVKDLEKWQFRPQDRDATKGQLTWQDVEALVCQRRLEKILRQKKENPQKPFGSLLQPGEM